MSSPAKKYKKWVLENNRYKKDIILTEHNFKTLKNMFAEMPKMEPNAKNQAAVWS